MDHRLFGSRSEPNLSRILKECRGGGGMTWVVQVGTRCVSLKRY